MRFKSLPDAFRGKDWAKSIDFGAL